MSLIFDLETGPLDEKTLAAICPEFTPPPPPPGEFDPSKVAVGNLKDQAKIDEKIAKAREAHAAAVINYDRDRLTLAEQHFADFKSKAALHWKAKSRCSLEARNQCPSTPPTPPTKAATPTSCSASN